MAPWCNATLEDLTVDGEVRYSVRLTFHEIGLIISAVFGVLAIVISSFIIFMHAFHYSRPEEQKHIIRIVFMIPVYAVVAFLSYYYYLHYIYFNVMGDCYEAFALASFFTLMCTYIRPKLHDQKEYFRTITTKNWIWPIPWFQACTGGAQNGVLRKPRSGLTWFNIVWVCIFQYCFIRVLFTIIAVITQAAGVYCQDTLSPKFAHVWVEVFEAISVSIAMYGVIQFYYQTREEIAEHRPFMKILCIKLVIFFSFWQTLIISFATSHGYLHAGDHIKYPDLAVGLPSMLICLEMFLFSILHISAFSWKPYLISKNGGKAQRIDSVTSYEQGTDGLQEPGAKSSGIPSHYIGGFLGWRAFAQAFNPWDIIKASARGFRWLFVGSRRRFDDPSYHRQAGAEPFGSAPIGTELKDRGNGPMNGQTYGYQSEQNVPVGCSETTYSGPPNGGYSKPAPYNGTALPDPSPYRPPNPSWQPRGDDDEAWRPTMTGADDESRRNTPEIGDKAGLLRNAMHPGYHGPNAFG